MPVVDTAELSVVLPVFGNHQAIETLPVVCQAWLAQDVLCEVVIGVAAGTEIPPVAGDRVRVVRADEALTAPGPLRNIAAAAARAPVLYLSDGDVAPLGRDFAGQALKLMGDQALVQPWMYRLVNPLDAAASSADRPFERPRGRACHVSVDAEGQLIPLAGERFRWLSPKLLTAEPPPGFGWRYEDQTPGHAFSFHWGGISVRRETFDAVGGYCARYSGWGCEDDDLIAKLEERIGVSYAFRAHARALSCLHYEHPRAHTSTHFEANKAILFERLAAGVDAMIEEDAR
ncbi:MAG TPA: galactosyltransferase-related protein [Streptosporangiaceae bacterium]|nr:galactosyltransferase-related protein [Streptosporangiaceae bacterium]